jgi:hypothetical protein
MFVLKNAKTLVEEVIGKDDVQLRMQAVTGLQKTQYIDKIK